MARHCVKWSGKKRRGRRKGLHCAHGRVKSGPRKGRCRKHKVGRRRSHVAKKTGYRTFART